MKSSDTEAARPFVEFKDVWLCYYEELLQANHFAGALDVTNHFARHTLAFQLGRQLGIQRDFFAVFDRFDIELFGQNRRKIKGNMM